MEALQHYAKFQRLTYVYLRFLVVNTAHFWAVYKQIPATYFDGWSLKSTRFRTSVSTTLTATSIKCLQD